MRSEPVPGTPGPRALIDAVLDGAEVLVHAYDGYDAAAARERIARALVGGRCAAATGPYAGRETSALVSSPGQAPVAPALCPTEREQATHELDVVIALILGDAHAAPSLQRLADHACIDSDGALVFACLLHISGREDAARFWWQFAAGLGNRMAAYCLHLHHRSYGEMRDAGYWRAQAQAPDAGCARPVVRVLPSAELLLFEGIGKEILAQCHDGSHPRLPLALEAAINRLRVDSDDGDFGEIPQPSRDLATELAAHAH
jgi:hypothetical protein